MGEEEFVLALFGIIAGTTIAGIFFGGIFSVIKSWINRKKSDSELDPRFFKALSEFKRNTENRLGNLEAIVIEEDDAPVSEREREFPPIQIEEEEVRGKGKGRQKNSGNLRNMLDE